MKICFIFIMLVSNLLIYNVFLIIVRWRHVALGYIIDLRTIGLKVQFDSKRGGMRGIKLNRAYRHFMHFAKNTEKKKAYKK